MDQAIEHFKVILETAIKSETTPLLTEITADKVALLTAGLSEKDRQCRHLMDLLRSKNSEWKRIKSELVLRRDGGTGSGCAKAAAADISAVLDDDNHEDGDEDSLNDCTQLPASQSQIHSQSNLDALVSLISETESEGPEIVIEAAASRPPPAASSARKRKSHARGCACCEKYYSATRSASDSHNFTSADSFIVSPKTPPGFWDTSFTPRQ